MVARIHSGDPALWGAVQEQRELCDELGLPHEIVPGVSAFSAVAALAGRELTVPEVAQSVILTRLGGGKTPMPAGEEIARVRPARHHDGGVPVRRAVRAASGRTARRRLPAGHAGRRRLPGDLAGRAARATARVGTLAETVRAHKLWKHTLFLVGPALAAERHPLAPLPPRPLPRLPPGRAAGARELRTADAALREAAP